ncbi:MAG: hypothetical protein QOG80_259 [Pseudonocardiales bacterium]|nr:hypothetical protein [Pseudonocardiales bacterium]
MRRTRVLYVAACCVLVLPACGSMVSPGQFINVNGRRGGGGTNSAIAAATNTAGPLGSGAPTGRAVSTNGTGPGGSNAPGASNGPGGTGPSGGNQPAVPGITAGSCAGFKNTVGISNSTIQVANASDVSGPVPGLFTAAQQATKAYAAYFNSTSTICGRKLNVQNYDSQTSGSGDQQAATQSCSGSFAMVGSMGAFDSGGAQTVASCGIPDLRAIITTPERAASPVSFGTDSINPVQVSTAQYRYLKGITGNAYQHMAVLYLNAGAATPNALADKATAQHVGFNVVYTQPIDVTTFNYTPYVTQMKQKGVTFVQYVGAYQYAIKIRQAMESQSLNPAFMMDSVAYDPAFVKSGGSAIDGTYAFVDTNLFEEASRSPELQTYLTWLQRVAPGATPSFFGVFAWGAMKLFTQLAVQLGGQLTRTSMLTAIRGVHSYTASGLFTTQDVGGKKTPSCQAVIQLQGAKWVRKSPFPYTCADVFNTK